MSRYRFLTLYLKLGWKPPRALPRQPQPSVLSSLSLVMGQGSGVWYDAIKMCYGT